VRIFRRIGGQDSSDGPDGRPAVGGHSVMLPRSSLRAAEVVMTDPATCKINK
jgi:hypothetical protein